MDLFAYAQIKDLDAIAKANGIEVPRLRGYRLMAAEKPVTREEIQEMIRDASVEAVRHLCAGNSFWNPHSEYYTYGAESDRIFRRYLTFTTNDKGYTEWTGIRWDRIRGWKRKVLKFEIKKAKRAVLEQYGLWNKYAGQQNILYIHARMGSWSWTDPEARRNLYNQPWVIGYADDWWDRTYCDLYAEVKIDE